MDAVTEFAATPARRFSEVALRNTRCRRRVVHDQVCGAHALPKKQRVIIDDLETTLTVRYRKHAETVALCSSQKRA